MNNNFKPLIGTVHDFLGSKGRFIHTSTVTGSDSCYGKNYAYPRVHLVVIIKVVDVDVVMVIIIVTIVMIKLLYMYIIIRTSDIMDN